MSTPRIQIADDASSVAAAAGDVVEELIRLWPSAVLALPTGRTPIALYQELIRRSRLGRIDWSAVRAFNLDEWVGVRPESEASYTRFMVEQLYGHVNIPRSQCYIPDGTAIDLDHECRKYEEAIELAGGIDLAILGIGRNGHIGFNEPGTAFNARTHVAAVSEDTRRANAYAFPSGDPSRQAITVGIATILQSRRILLLVTGSEKSAILHQSLFGPVEVAVPASALQRHPNVTVIVDRAASSRLTRSELQVKRPG